MRSLSAAQSFSRSSRTTLGLVIGSLALIGSVLASSAEANWSPAANLSAAQGENKWASVAMAPDGATTVAWQAIGTAEIMVSTRPAGTSSSFSTPVRISTPSPSGGGVLGGSEGGPEVAIDRTGRTTIVWTQYPPQDTGGLTVWAATRPAGSNTFSTPVALSDPGSDAQGYRFAYTPEIAIDPTGKTTVVWGHTSDGDGLEVQASTRPAGSNTFGAPVEVSQAGAAFQDDRNPHLAMGPDGRTTVVWQSLDFDSGETSLRASTRPANSDTFAPPETLSSAEENPVEGQRVAIGPDGKTTVVWGGTFCTQGQCNGRVIESRTRPAGSNTFGAPETLSPFSYVNFYSDPQIAVGPSGQTTVVWDEDQVGVVSRTRPAGSTTFGAEEVISTTTSRSQSPQIAIGPDGRTTIAWLDNLTNTGMNGYSVLTAIRPTGATSFQTPVFLQRSGMSDAPAVAAGPCDGFTTVVWQNETSYPLSSIQQSSNPTGACRLPRPSFRLRFTGKALAEVAKTVRLKFQLTNTGDAVANKISLRVTGGGVDARQSTGSLGTSKTKTVEVPVKFKKAGKFQITARVTATDAVPASTQANIRVVR